MACPATSACHKLRRSWPNLVITVAHVITGLSTGGAETMLHRLVSALDRAAFRSCVISLTDAGSVADKILALGVPVSALDMRPGIPNPLALARLARMLRRFRPQVIQTWMYHANLLGGLASVGIRNTAVVWNLRRGRLDRDIDARGTLWTSRVCAALSGWLPTRIICCSEATRQWHIGAGYASDRMMVVPNGVDAGLFRPNCELRTAVRAELGLAPSAVLIGLAARFEPTKDHKTFVEAAATLRAALPEARFLLCGDGVSWENTRLAGWIQAAGIGDRCHLLGRRDDMPRLMASLDLAVSSSKIEGFPNVVAEALACGVPCVVTDVGDSARIVGSAGLVVPPGSPRQLAAACTQILELPPEARAQMGTSGRRRIMDNFSLPVVAAQYRQLYEELASDVRDCRIH